MMLSKSLIFLLMIRNAVDVSAEDNTTTVTTFYQDQEYNNSYPHTIIGGYPLSPEDRKKRPYLVTLGVSVFGSDYFMCGGSLISPRAVLTAAHCASGYLADPPEWVDFYGYNLTEPMGSVRVWLAPEDIVFHQSFDPFTGNSDVAILFLPFALGIAPVTLNADPNVPVSNGVPLDVSGWGLTSNDGNETSDIPNAVTLRYLTNKDCTKTPYKWDKSLITDEKMCATENGKSVCNGDSGGPLVLGKGGSNEGPLSPVVQVGIVSFTSADGCENSEYPSVFTRVSEVVNWITSTVFQHTGEIIKTTASSSPPTSGKSSKTSSKSGKDPKKFLRI